MNIICRLTLKAFENIPLEEFTKVVSILCLEQKLNMKKFILPKKKKRITLLNSPHVHKKAREQFELSTYKTLLDISGNSNDIHFFVSALKKSYKNKLRYDIKYIIS